MNKYAEQITKSRRYIPAVKDALLATYFSDYDPAFLQSAAGQEDIDNNVYKRYDQSLKHVLPWLSKHTDLAGKNVLEIGCGTGSSTAALAHYVDYIDAFDIHALSIDGAKKRLDIMGLHNVGFHLIDEESLVSRISPDDTSRYDIILLYAVLEHQTIAERHATLEKCWELLADDGIMAVIDTPNVLHYYDIHTSKLPFLHMLPSRLYAKYAANSPRCVFADSFNGFEQKNEGQLDRAIARWGRGVSFHDFELTLGKRYSDYIVADGFEPEILQWYICTPEEEILRWYVLYKGFTVPLGFTRCVLNLIFKKTSELAIQKRPLKNSSPPPPYEHLTTNPHELLLRIDMLEKELSSKEHTISQIYNSTTWRLGNIFAHMYRKMLALFKIAR